MKYDKQYLYDKYNATATDDGAGELETYENWLERQLISRIEEIERLNNFIELPVKVIGTGTDLKLEVLEFIRHLPTLPRVETLEESMLFLEPKKTLSSFVEEDMLPQKVKHRKKHKFHS